MNEQIYIPSLASTNAWMQQKWQADNLPEGVLVHTSFQTNGRGQLTNTWESEKEKNLLFSILFRPVWLSVKEQFLLSQAVALAVVDFLSTMEDGFMVKWPNDIYWRDKKIAGILIENNLSGTTIAASIVGIGLNVNQKEFVSDAPNPISLWQIIGRESNLSVCLNELQAALKRRYLQAQQQPQEVRNDYLKVLYRYQQWAMYEDEYGVFEGCIEYVEPQGFLHVKDREGKDRRYAFKEVHFLL